jgi:hypothetical protein
MDRVEWPEVQQGAGGAGRGEKKKATVPAYKCRVFAAIAKQATTEDSQNHLRSLLVDPLKKKLKDLKDSGQAVTIDTEVVDSPEFLPDIQRLPFQPKGTGASSAADSGPRRPGLRGDQRITVDLDAPQKAGAFHGTEVSWYMRLAEPKEEVAPEPEPEKGGKGSKKPSGPKKKTSEE